MHAIPADTVYIHAALVVSMPCLRARGVCVVYRVRVYENCSVSLPLALPFDRTWFQHSRRHK